MLPFEFIVEGTPISVQAKRSLKWWKQKVTDAAKLAWPTTAIPLVQELKVIITHFYVDLPPVDVDNIIKPIQDALIGLVYDDDHQIADTRVRRLSLDVEYLTENISSILNLALDKRQEFVHIKISVPLNNLRLDL